MPALPARPVRDDGDRRRRPTWAGPGTVAPRARHAVTAAVVAVAIAGGIAPVSAAAAQAAGAASTLAAIDAVDLFIGTQQDRTENKGNSAYGNTSPGATTPFGMVNFNPTTYSTTGGDNWGGYEYDADQLRGFGLNRLSGTGCANNNGAFDFPILPYTGALTDTGALPVSPADDIRGYYLDFSHADEVAAPGFYSVLTDNGVSSSLTATPRSAVAQFDFPGDKDSSTLVFDIAGSNNGSRDSAVSIDGSTVSGWTETTTVCGGGRYKAYFSATFDTPVVSSGTWVGSEVSADGTAGTATGGHSTGAFITFGDGAEVTARVGLSYVSVENAAENAATEAGASSFDQIRAAATDRWSEALGTIDATGGAEDERIKLYTALYHSLLHPNLYDDVNGEYFGYDGTLRSVVAGHHEYSTYAGWDIYRSQVQLVALLFPDIGSDINQSITDMATQTGKWPNWPHLGVSQQKMSGDSLQSVVASIDAFGSTDYDRDAALASMVATQTLPDTSTNRVNGYQYTGLGFIESRKNDAATSKTLEYAIDDFGIAQLAGRLGDDDAYATFMTRAQSWQNVFDPVTEEIRPRERNGFVRDFDLAGGGSQFEQGTGYQYGWMVPQNLGTLIAKRGGVEEVTAELDHFLSQLDVGANGTEHAYLSNQPSMHTPWIYNWLGAPSKATDTLDRAMDLFDTSPTGLPGNDDLGSLSAWYVWANIGLYPAVYGRAELVVSSPMFEDIDIASVGSDRTISITAPGADENRYMDGMSVDGVVSTASWLPESFAQQGGTLDLTMSAAAGAWGTRATDAPPSFTDGSDAYNNIGATPDGQGDLGSLEASDNTLSREKLAEAGATPGAELPLGDTGVTFVWPDTAVGEPDNWVPHGQVVDMGDVTAEGISFLGLATNGPAQGTATVVYTDGSTQSVPVQLTDWTPGTNYQFGNVPVITTSGRNKRNGTSDTVPAKVFGTVPTPVDAGKSIDSVILPESTDRGIMHIFDVATTTKEDPNAPSAAPKRIVLNPTKHAGTSQAVMWRTRGFSDAGGTVQIRRASGGRVRTVPAVDGQEMTAEGYPARSHSAIITGLRPGTDYRYRVGAGDLVNSSSDDSEWTDWFGAMDGYSQTSNVIAAPGNHEYSGDSFLKTWKTSFEFPLDEPTAEPARDDSPAQRQRAAYREHMAVAVQETAYYTDYQGVRFIALNASTGDASALMTPADLPACSEGCPDPQAL